MAKKKAAAPPPMDDDEETPTPGPKIAETPEEKEVLKSKPVKDKKPAAPKKAEPAPEPQPEPAAKPMTPQEMRKAAVKAFTGLPGIGRSKAEALYEAGFKTVDDLIRASVQQVAGAEGIGPKLAQAIKTSLPSEVPVQEGDLAELLSLKNMTKPAAEALYRHGYRTKEDLKRTPIEYLLDLDDVSEELAESLKDQVINIEESIEEFMEISGIGRSKAEALVEAGYKTVYDLQRASLDDLSEIAAVGDELAERIKDEVGEFVDTRLQYEGVEYAEVVTIITPEEQKVMDAASSLKVKLPESIVSEIAKEIGGKDTKAVKERVTEIAKVHEPFTAAT